MVLWARWMVVAGALAALGGCASAPLRQQTAPPAAQLAQQVTWENFDADVMAWAVFAESNRVRHEHRRHALRAYPRLDRAADLQAATTALIGFPSHSNPLAGRGNVYDRVLATGIRPRLVGENVATTSLRGDSVDADADGDTDGWRTQTYAELAEQIVQQWLDSPPHRAALLSPRFTHLACGAALARGPDGAELVFSVQVFLVPAQGRTS